MYVRSLVIAACTLVTACGAPDAGTYCLQGYHCISGSCTLGTCDAFPACWPGCDSDDDEQREPAPPPPRVPMDAGPPCTLKLCSELSLDECVSEPGCTRQRACLPDAGAPDVWLPYQAP
ncbi:MAG TPA: hypothetical protein VFX59_20635, partial [Polyangiales bacterium]|nr:hypothetical protein [Polyangiales bacterium]